MSNCRNSRAICTSRLPVHRGCRPVGSPAVLSWSRPLRTFKRPGVFFRPVAGRLPVDAPDPVGPWPPTTLVVPGRQSPHPILKPAPVFDLRHGLALNSPARRRAVVAARRASYRTTPWPRALGLVVHPLFPRGLGEPHVVPGAGCDLWRCKDRGYGTRSDGFDLPAPTANNTSLTGRCNTVSNSLAK